MSHLTKSQIDSLELPEMKYVEHRLGELVKGSSNYPEAITGYVLNMGGKRIRPLLVMLCSGIYRANLKARVDVAAAAELIHTASLLHDDVVDDAPIRRGKPSVNSRWGNPTSVLAGDFLFAKAFSVLSRYPRTLEVMTEAIATMCEGELTQLNAHFDPKLTPAAYVETIAGKTASLLAASCEGGAMLSTMPAQQVKTLRNFGLHLGIAYQILDDIGDYTLDSGQSGKPQGSDIKQGIITLPLLYLLANPSTRERVEGVLAENTPLEPQALAPELTEIGALEKAAETACRHIDAALNLLKDFPRCRSILILSKLAAEFQERCRACSKYPPYPEPPGHAFQHPSPEISPL